MKTCKTCKKDKGVAEFYKGDPSCKPCRREMVREYRKNNIDKVREYDRNRPNHAERLEHNKRNYRERISTPEGRKREWESKKKYRSSTKRAAHTIIGNAIKGGKIKREPCCKCGNPETDAHHEDYYSPLDVIWLCKKHHGERHREINEAIRNGEDWTDRGF